MESRSEIRTAPSNSNTAASARSLKWGFHSLRHTFVSLCRESNAPLAVVEAIVGHANPAMTRHYTHVGDLAASQAVAALPAFIGANGHSIPAMVDDGLSQRDEEILAVLEGSTAKTWKRDRDKVVGLIRRK
ncbi:MAG: tyrosine-type recombinase/integrase [Kiritimatiellia bacterium]